MKVNQEAKELPAETAGCRSVEEIRKISKESREEIIQIPNRYGINIAQISRTVICRAI